jgi:outer membrane lipoprotein LolB
VKAALFCAALLLAGCANLEPSTRPAATGAQAEQRIIGKISVQVQDERDPDQHKGGNGSFELLGGPAAGQLELSTPLGGLIARASWTEREVQLTTPQGTRNFADLDSLSREMLGEAIPVAALFDWMQGRPWSGAPSQTLTDGFEQLGWRIELSRFSDGIISATRSYAPIVTLRARIEK